MSKIDFIKNITVFQDFSFGVTDFYQKFNINNQPDECIIRSISYVGPIAPLLDIPGIYMIWSDLINDYICSFAIDGKTSGSYWPAIINASPQIQIHLKQPINFSNNIRFVLYKVDPGNAINRSTFLLGQFSMNIDFITYKK